MEPLLVAAVHVKLQGFKMLYIEIKKLNENATTPTKSHEYDAGWDLYASEDCIIEAGNRTIIKTGISMAIPNGWVGLIWPRSGLSVKSGINVLAGVIDAPYRGEILVCLHNTSKPHPNGPYNDLHVNKGDRIAQILFHEVPECKMIEVESLEETERNSNGFGSTGH